MKKILILVTVWLGLSFGLIFNAHAAGRINVMLSGGPLQSFEYKDKETEPDSESGFGLVFDYIFPGGHAIAVDYYSFTEVQEINDSDVTDEYSGVFLGYRHHFPFGFYLGGGVILLDSTRTRSDFPLYDEDGNIIGADDLVGKFERASPITVTLGYQHAFSSGFALGAHLLNTLPTTLKLDTLRHGGETSDAEGELEDFSIRSVGFLVGYAW